LVVLRAETGAVRWLRQVFLTGFQDCMIVLVGGNAGEGAGFGAWRRGGLRTETGAVRWRRLVF